MTGDYHELTTFQVGVAVSLILCNAAVSLLLQLGLERSLMLASMRTVAQLLAIGFVLQWVFQQQRMLVVLLIMLAMTMIAGLTAWQRTERRYPGMLLTTLVSMMCSSWLILAVAMAGVFERIEYWYDPQYAIPLLGMLLGNTLNGITLGMNGLLDGLISRRDQVETLLSLGATRWEAARGSVSRAIQTGMIPIINAMMVVGLVSLPGMMTGQLLSGVPPAQAVKYQIVIMFLIASTTALGVVIVVLSSYVRLFSADHQFRHSLISQRRSTV